MNYREALISVRYDYLPNNFNQWNLSDRDGWTVAHVAALLGHLPPSFNQWNLADKNGVTVGDLFIKNCLR